MRRTLVTKDELRIILNLNSGELFLGFICIHACSKPKNLETRTNFIETYNVKNFKNLNDDERVEKLNAMYNVYYELYFKDKLN